MVGVVELFDEQQPALALGLRAIGDHWGTQWMVEHFCIHHKHVGDLAFGDAVE
jgi:hypothetical protein